MLKSAKRIIGSCKRFVKKVTMPMVKQPKAIKEMKTKIIIYTIIGSVILDFLSFSLKAAEVAIDHNLIFISVIMLFLYFGKNIISSSFDTYIGLQDDLFSQISTSETTQIIVDITNLVRNKVITKDGDRETIMDTAEIIQKIKWYLDSVWQLFWSLPKTISDTLTLIIMTIGMIILELYDGNSTETLIIVFLLILCICIFFYLSKRRISCMKKYRKVSRDAATKEEILYTEIKHINFISEKDFSFHAQNLRNKLSQNRIIRKDQNLELNKVFIQRSIISSIFMILILIIKIYFSKGLTLNVILDVIATSSVYSTILSKITQILSMAESLADKVLDINTIYDDFKAITDVYQEESEKSFVTYNVEGIDIDDFKVTQDKNGSFLLQNKNNFSLSKGDFVLIKGPTGCGKSTLILLLTGRLRVKNNPIHFGSANEKGYLSSIFYQTDNVLANNYALNEITLSESKDFDKEKLIYILKGLLMYDILLDKANKTESISKDLSDDEKVIEVLNRRKTSEFSSGQMQRIALAKLLYTLSPEHQIVALDEAFNRLDDKTATACIRFIHEYLSKDSKRIVLLSTHQVELVRAICNKEISFAEDIQDVSQITIRDI